MLACKTLGYLSHFGLSSDTISNRFQCISVPEDQQVALGQQDAMAAEYHVEKVDEVMPPGTLAVQIS